MDTIIKQQAKKLPKAPGVYFFKDSADKVLYIGKAGNLKARVSSYFSKSSELSGRIAKMLTLASKIEHIKTFSEIEALFLESELIKRYKPPYNVEWKDEKNFLYVKITKKDEFPGVFFTRRALPDSSLYFGPFTDATAVRQSMKILRKIFPIRTTKKFPHKICLWGHLGQCPCAGISKQEYHKTIKQLVLFFSGKKLKILTEFRRDMKKAAKARQFEEAASLRDKIAALEGVGKRFIFQKEAFDIGKDKALLGLTNTLGLKNVPGKIEAFDISNIQGFAPTGSLVLFQNGVANRHEYRKFAIRGARRIDDYGMMREVLERRFGGKEKGILPDLIIVDGGKGQLSVAIAVLKKYNLKISAIGLAKRNEEIITRVYDKHLKIAKFKTILLPPSSEVLFLLQRIRDEAHRFAITYHRLLREKHAKRSLLDEVPGLGSRRRKKLLLRFGSLDKIREAEQTELAKVVGKAVAKNIKETL